MTGLRPDNEVIFHAARDIPEPERRREYVREACGGDETRIAYIEALLAAVDGTDTLLDRPAADISVAIFDQPAAEIPGTVIGPFKLIEPIGEGGMGSVWMAQQTAPVKRLVALKLIKAGMDSRQVIARFEAERQALALMDHPNIARVLDAGTTSAGRPFFVMDLVKGVPITRYCDEHHLTPRQRLELFIPVCQAVQHAHQKGIIHRDLKPSNVLVALYDGKPVPKIIDFGVAKAAGQQLTDKTLVTGFGSIVGTLEYMSPEQAEVNQLDIDTRSDIYSLGVLLYELLAGSPPFSRQDLEKAGMLEMLRVIREQEPSKPSTKLSTAEGLPTLAANRGTEPARLTKLVRGELDWIVMKALEKDRNRRYETANGFAMDVQRYLADEPVQACPPSARYRLQKFLRRNKGPLLAASLVFLALVAGVAVSSWQWWRAERHARAERQERKRAETKSIEAAENARETREAIKKSFTRLSESKLLNQPGLQPLRMQLLQDAREFYEKFLERSRNDPELQAELAAAYMRMSTIYIALDRNDEASEAVVKGFQLADKLLQQRPHDHELAEQLAGYFEFRRALGDRTTPPRDPAEVTAALERATVCWEAMIGDNPGSMGLQSDLAGQYYLLGLLQQNVGKPVEAFDSHHKAGDLAETLIRSVPAIISFQELLLAARDGEAYAIQSAKPAESDSIRQRVIEFFERMTLEYPAVPGIEIDLAFAHRQWADRLRNSGRLVEAEKAYRQAIAVLEDLEAQRAGTSDSRSDLGAAYDLLATLLRASGRNKEAEDILRKAAAINDKLSIDFPKSADYRLSLLDHHRGRGDQLRESKPQEAALAFRRAFAVAGQLVVDFPDAERYRTELIRTQEQLVAILLETGQPREIEKAYRQTIARVNMLAGGSSPGPKNRLELGRNHNRLGIFLRNAGRTEEAKRELDKALAYWSNLPDPGLQWKNKTVSGNARHNLARAYYQQGGWKEAMALHGVGSSAWQWLHLAMIHWQLEHNDDAHRFYDRSLDQMATSQDKRLRDVQMEAANLLGQPDPGDRSEKAWRLYAEADTYARQGNAQKSKECYDNATALYEKLTSDFPGVPAFRVKLVETLAKTGRLEEAERVYRDSSARLEQLAKGPGNRGEERRDVALWCDSWASCLKEAGRFKEAEEVHRRAIALWEGLVTDFPATQAYRLDFGHSLWHLSQLLIAAGQTTDVEKVLRKALAVFEQLAIDFPSELYYQVEAAHTSWALLGPFLAAQPGRRKDAEQVYRRGVAAHEKLVANLPKGDTEIRRRLASNYDDAANVLRADGRVQDAANVYRQATDFYARLVTNDPDQSVFRIALADAYRKVADLLREAGQMPESEQAARKSIEIYAKLAASFPQNSNYRREVGESRKRLAAIQAPSHALAFARALDHIRLSEWDKAAAEYAKLDLSAKPLGDDAFGYGCLFLIREDSNGYNRFCQEMIQSAARTEDPFEAFILARTCAMARQSPVDPARVVQWANQAIARDQPAWYVHALGLAQYRTGQFDQALQSFTKANVEAWAARELNWFGLALVHHRLSHPDEARQSLKKGIQWLEREGPPGPGQPTKIHPSDWLEAQVLRREAEETLKIKQSP